MFLTRSPRWDLTFGNAVEGRWQARGARHSVTTGYSGKCSEAPGFLSLKGSASGHRHGIRRVERDVFVLVLPPAGSAPRSGIDSSLAVASEYYIITPTPTSNLSMVCTSSKGVTIVVVLEDGNIAHVGPLVDNYSLC